MKDIVLSIVSRLKVVVTTGASMQIYHFFVLYDIFLSMKGEL